MWVLREAATTCRRVLADPRLVFLLGVGLLVRLAIMPWAMHSDLLSMTWRTYLMQGHGLWQLPTNQFVGHVLYAANLKVLTLFGLNPSAWFQQSFGLYPGSKTASVGDWLFFLQQPQVNAAIFGLHIPHLLADMAVVVGLAAVLKKTRYWKQAVLSWWLNPVVLYAGYIFSRHDIFTAAAVLLVIVAMAYQRWWLAFVAVYIGYQVRVQPLMYLPLIAISSWRQKHSLVSFAKAVLVAAILILAALMFRNTLPFNQAQYDFLTRTPDLASQQIDRDTDPVTWVDKLGVPSGLLDQMLGSGTISIPLFVPVYGLLLVGWWFVAQMRTPQTELGRVAGAFTIVTALLFVTTTTSAHYFMWLCLPMAMVVAYRPRLLISYGVSVLAWALYNCLNSDVTTFTHYLFLPISIQLWYLPTLYQVLVSQVGADTVQALSFWVRTLWAGSLLWLSGELVHTFFQKDIDRLLPLTLGKSTTKTLATVALVIALAVGSSLVVSNRPAPDEQFVYPVSSHQSTLFSPDWEWVMPGERQQGTVVVEGNSIGRLELLLSNRNTPSYDAFMFRVKSEGSDEWWFENAFALNNIYSGWYFPVGFPPISTQNTDTLVWEIELPPENAHALGVKKVEPFADLSKTARLKIVADDVRTKIITQPVFFLGYFGVLIALSGSLCFYAIHHQRQLSQR